MRGRKGIRAVAARFGREMRGVAATEFVLVAPVLVLLFAGAVETGLVVMARMQVNEAVSAAANSAISFGPSITSSSADAKAATLATVLRRANGGRPEEAKIRITYNGARVYDFVGTASTASGAISAVDECRCPTFSNGVIAWGGSVTCKSVCPNKSLAGRYVSIDVTRSYTPLFANYGFISGEGIHVQTLALAQ